MTEEKEGGRLLSGSRANEDPVRRGGREGPGGFEFELTGGAPCLDLVNTVDERPTATPRERLRSYRDLVGWSRQAGLVSPADASRLLKRADRQPRAAEAALRRVRGVREALHRIMASEARGEPAPAEDVARLEGAARAALSRRRLEPRPGGGLRWTWGVDGETLDAMLDPVLLSAVDLLTGDDRGRLRECAADECGWLFLDRSRNGSRRWCDMTVCGNRAKARRHRSRLRSD